MVQAPAVEEHVQKPAPQRAQRGRLRYVTPERLQRGACRIRPSLGMTVGKHGSIHRAGRSTSDAVDLQPGLLQQPIESTPSKGAVRAAALQSEIDENFTAARAVGFGGCHRRCVPLGSKTEWAARVNLVLPDRAGKARLLIGCEGLGGRAGLFPRTEKECQQQARFEAREVTGRGEMAGDQVDFGPGIAIGLSEYRTWHRPRCQHYRNFSGDISEDRRGVCGYMPGTHPFHDDAGIAGCDRRWWNIKTRHHAAERDRQRGYVEGHQHLAERDADHRDPRGPRLGYSAYR